MKKIKGITLATLGILGVIGAIKFGKSAIQIYRNNNTTYPGPYETSYEPYYETLSQSMLDAVSVIKSKTASHQEKRDAAVRLKELLRECLTIKELDELTAIYRDKQSAIIIGYDPVSVSQFVSKFNMDAKNGRLKPMTERRELKPEDNEQDVTDKSEEIPFKKCFAWDCDEDYDCEAIDKYAKLAHDMNKDINILLSDFYPKEMKLIISHDLNYQLTALLDDEVIGDLVDIYRYHKDDSIIGFKEPSVYKFVFELRKRYTTMPEAGEYFEVMLDNKEHIKALQTLFEFLYEEYEFGTDRDKYVTDFIYKDELGKLHVGILTDEHGKQSFEFYIDYDLVAYGDIEQLPYPKLRVSFLDNIEDLATEHIPNIMKHLLRDKHNFAKKALSER